MKKLLAIIILIAGFTITSNAQSSLVSQYNLTIDTVTNTGVKYLYLSAPYGTFFKTVDIAVIYTKISGTLGGTIAVEYSLDNTVWYTAAQDTVLTVTDAATKSLGWQLKDKSIKYLRIRATGAGTMSSKISAKIWAKKENT